MAPNSKRLQTVRRPLVSKWLQTARELKAERGSKQLGGASVIIEAPVFRWAPSGKRSSEFN